MVPISRSLPCFPLIPRQGRRASQCCGIFPSVSFSHSFLLQHHSASRAPENVIPAPVLAVRVRRDHVGISFYCLHRFRRVVELAAEGMTSLTVCSPIGRDLASAVFLFEKQ